MFRQQRLMSHDRHVVCPCIQIHEKKNRFLMVSCFPAFQFSSFPAFHFRANLAFFWDWTITRAFLRKQSKVDNWKTLIYVFGFVFQSAVFICCLLRNLFVNLNKWCFMGENLIVFQKFTIKPCDRVWMARFDSGAESGNERKRAFSFPWDKYWIRKVGVSISILFAKVNLNLVACIPLFLFWKSFFSLYYFYRLNIAHIND